MQSDYQWLQELKECLRKAINARRRDMWHEHDYAEEYNRTRNSRDRRYPTIMLQMAKMHRRGAERALERVHFYRQLVRETAARMESRSVTVQAEQSRVLFDISCYDPEA